MIPIEVYLRERKQPIGFTLAKPHVYNKYELRLKKKERKKKYLQGINRLLIQSCYMLTNVHKLFEEKQMLFFHLLLKKCKDGLSTEPVIPQFGNRFPIKIQA